MAQTVFSGNFGGVSAGTAGRSLTLARTSGNILPANAIISDVTFRLRLTAGGWSSAYDWNVYWYTITNGPSVSGSPWYSQQMADDDVTLVRAMPITPDAGLILEYQLPISVKANTSHPSTSYMWETSVTITYEIPTACTAPTALDVTDENPTPGSSVTLSWGGDDGGNVNDKTGNDIYRATSADGEYTYLKSVAGTEPGGSTSVTAPSVLGQSYYYKIVTKGALGEDYYSGLSAAYVGITATTEYCSAPTALSLSALVSATPPLFRWGNAKAGHGNPITGYALETSESADNASWGSWTALTTLYTTNTYGAKAVPLAPTLGYYRRYRVKTLGTNAGYDSDWSAASASVRTSSSTAVNTQTPMLIVYEYPHVVYGVEYGPYPIGLVQKYNTLIWTRRYQDLGEFSLSMPFDAEACESLQRGNLIGIAGRNELMMILAKTIYKDGQGVETIEIRGKSMALMLGMRVVTYSVLLQANPVEQIKSLLRSQPIFCEHYDSGWVDDFNADLAADGYGDRRFPDFHWQEPAFSYADDDDISYQPEKLAQLLDGVISLCKIKGCGLRVTSQYLGAESFTQTMYFELYMGVDRSVSQDTNPHVVFDEILGNVISQTYTQSIENKKTAGYAINAPIDTLTETDLRLVDITSENDYSAGDQAYINDGTPTANVNGGSGMNRNELGLTVVEIDEPTEGTTNEKIQKLYDSSKQIGRNEIEKAAEEHTFDIEVNPSVGPQYRVDYDLGDTATARNGRWGVSMDGVISETQETYEAGKKMRLSLTLGSQRITLLGRVKQISRRRG